MADAVLEAHIFVYALAFSDMFVASHVVCRLFP